MILMSVSRLTFFAASTLLCASVLAAEDAESSTEPVSSSVDEAIEETLNFYRVYHSMRYVNNRLVFRLKAPLADSKLAYIQEHYSDILVDGTYEQTAALPEETGEADLNGLPRLVFHFNRRALGRLRMLIDCINGRPD